MRVIVPIDIDGTNMTSNVPEDDATAWTAGTYSIGAEVMHESRVWESLVDSNTAEPGTDASKWLDTGATNRYKMFDEFVNTQTEFEDEIDVTITVTDIVRSMGIYELDGQELVITCTDSTEGVVFEKTVELLDVSVDDFDDYFFEPVRPIRDAHIMDLPPYPSMEVRIQVVDTGSTAKCGKVVLGPDFDAGMTKWGPRVGIISFSRKIRDDFGRIFAKQGRSSKRASIDLHVENSNVDYLQRQLQSVDGLICSFVGDPRDGGFQCLNILGFFRDFEETIPGPGMSACTIELEGLI